MHLINTKNILWLTLIMVPFVSAMDDRSLVGSVKKSVNDKVEQYSQVQTNGDEIVATLFIAGALRGTFDCTRFPAGNFLFENPYIDAERCFNELKSLYESQNDSGSKK